MPLPKLIIFSGAGLSAESGLPTFRGASGLWEGVPIEKVCHIDTWEENFEAVHDFYDARRGACLDAKPNGAHFTIAKWQQRWPDRTVILTQNIDRLLESAGCVKVIHLHGDMKTLWCVDCDHRWEVAGRYDRKGCPSCGNRASVKPAVIFFGECAPRYEDLTRIVRDLTALDTSVVVGTSGAVLPADQLFARSRAYSILVNLEPGTRMDESAFSRRLYGPATEHLPALEELIVARMTA